MGPREAALAVELLGVAEVVPIHHGTFPILAGTPDQLRSELAARSLGDVRVHAPQPGEGGRRRGRLRVRRVQRGVPGDLREVRVVVLPVRPVGAEVPRPQVAVRGDRLAVVEGVPALEPDGPHPAVGRGDRVGLRRYRLVVPVERHQRGEQRREHLRAAGVGGVRRDQMRRFPDADADHGGRVGGGHRPGTAGARGQRAGGHDGHHDAGGRPTDVHCASWCGAHSGTRGGCGWAATRVSEPR